MGLLDNNLKVIYLDHASVFPRLWVSKLERVKRTDQLDGVNARRQRAKPSQSPITLLDAYR